jgi:hypothetical protein
VKEPEKAHLISRRGFLGAALAVAGATVVKPPDRPAADPDRRLLAPKIRWIGHL